VQTVCPSSEQAMSQNIGTFGHLLRRCCTQRCPTCSKSSQWELPLPHSQLCMPADTGKLNFTAEWLTFLFCILEVPGSNPSLESSHLDWALHSLTQYLLANAGIEPQITTTTSTHIYSNSLIIQLFNAIQYELLNTKFNETQQINNKTTTDSYPVSDWLVMFRFS
jgi:hypothetical protein